LRDFSSPLKVSDIAVNLKISISLPMIRSVLLIIVPLYIFFHYDKLFGNNWENRVQDMDKKRYHSQEREDTICIGTSIGTKLKNGDIICLEGPLGAGKTTLVKGIAQALGIDEEVTSPSFTIVSSYSGNYELYHVDLYRIDHIDELYDIGMDDILDGDGITVIEWGEKIISYLPEQLIRIHISINKEDNSRNIDISGMKIKGS
jgi:tRNA threonylcarbamoyladenosine biosynthesis protein TsaE